MFNFRNFKNVYITSEILTSGKKFFLTNFRNFDFRKEIFPNFRKEMFNFRIV